MPIFSFLEYILIELFRKPGNWQQICKRTSWALYTLIDVSLKRVEKEKLLGRFDKDISLKIAFAK